MQVYNTIYVYTFIYIYMCVCAYMYLCVCNEFLIDMSICLLFGSYIYMHLCVDTQYYI